MFRQANSETQESFSGMELRVERRNNREDGVSRGQGASLRAQWVSRLPKELGLNSEGFTEMF